MFTDEDNRIFLDVWKETLDETPVNQSRTWTNPKSGHGGELTTLRAFDWHGSPCKEVQVRNQAQGRKGDERLNACKLGGQWKLMGAEHQTIGVYGMSETATCVTAARFDDPEPIRAGTFGRALPGMEIRIADPETRQAVPRGETGEILVKGSTLMEGYYRVPREQTFDAEGFFRTGDRGWLDDEGNLHFGGRIKDVIKTSGVNVAAAEVEEALARHPAVQSAHVVGVPDPVRGENIAALVVLRPGRGEDADTLREFCRAELASYKVPRHVFVVDAAAVPRTGTGKVEKPALRRAAEMLIANHGLHGSKSA